MEKNTIRAFELNDFPFAGGTFSPRFDSASIEMIVVQNKKIGTSTLLIQSSARLGSDIITKGAKVTSRLQYTVTNHTQGCQGSIELIGIENTKRHLTFFVSVSIPLNIGDEIDVKFDGVALNSARLH